MCFCAAFEVPGSGARVRVSAVDRSCPQVLPFPSSWIPVCAKPRGLTLTAVRGLRNAKHCLGEGCWTWQLVNKCMEDELGGVEGVGGEGQNCLSDFWDFCESKGRKRGGLVRRWVGLGGWELVILTVGWREGNRRSESPATGQGALAPDWSTMKTEKAVKGKGRVVDEIRESCKRGKCREVWWEKAIMMLTLPLQGSSSESCQLQATLAGGTLLGCLGMLTPQTPLTVRDRSRLRNYAYVSVCERGRCWGCLWAFVRACAYWGVSLYDF